MFLLGPLPLVASLVESKTDPFGTLTLFKVEESQGGPENKNKMKMLVGKGNTINHVISSFQKG